MMINAFRDHIDQVAPVWSDFASDDFVNWLKDSTRFLGSLALDHTALMTRTLPPKLRRSFQQSELFEERQQAVNCFFRTMQERWGQQFVQLFPVNKTTTEKTIVVISRTICGRGHETVAETLSFYLARKGYRIIIIDSKEFENAPKRTLEDIDRYYLIDQSTSELREMMGEIRPDLIISTVAHHNHWGQVAYDLSIPMLVVHTDYEIHASITKFDSITTQVFKMEDPRLVTYTLTDEGDHFSPLEEDTTEEQFHSLFHPLGFPVRREFVRENNPEQIEQLRLKYGFDKDQRGVLLMGFTKDDEEKYLDWVQSIHQVYKTNLLPIHLIIICGKNSKEYGKLSVMPPKNGVKVTVLQEAAAQEVADYMKIISRAAPKPGLLISKTGGSTTAEAVAMGVFTLALDLFPHEACNRTYMIRCGMGELVDESRLSSQIHQQLQWAGNPGEIYTPQLNWKKNIKKIVKDKIDGIVA